MRTVQSSVRTSSPEFRRRYAHNKALALQLRTRQEAARHERAPRDLERLASQGKLLPRQRLERLLDPGTPFLELSTLAANMVGKEVRMLPMMQALLSETAFERLVAKQFNI